MKPPNNGALRPEDFPIGSLESRAAARSLLENKPPTMSDEIEQAIKRLEEWNALPREEREARLQEVRNERISYW